MSEEREDVAFPMVGVGECWVATGAREAADRLGEGASPVVVGSTTGKGACLAWLREGSMVERSWRGWRRREEGMCWWLGG